MFFFSRRLKNVKRITFISGVKDFELLKLQAGYESAEFWVRMNRKLDTNRLDTNRLGTNRLGYETISTINTWEA